MNDQRKSVLRSVAILALAGCLVMGVSIALAGDEGAKEHAWLGVALSQQNDGPVKIVSVVEGGPAEAAGLLKGDVVMRVDGSDVSTSMGVVNAIRSRAPGDSITLEVKGEDGSIRSHSAVLEGRKARAYAFNFNGENFNIDLGDIHAEMSELRKHLGEGNRFKWAESGEPQGYLGVSLIQPTDDLREALGALEGEGVLVDKVIDESPAANAGLQAGDFIVSIDGEPVGSTGQLTQLIRSREPGTSVSLGIVRDRAPMSVTATLDESKSRVFFFRGQGEGDGANFESFEFDFDNLDQNIQDVLDGIRVDIHEDDDSGPMRKIMIERSAGSGADA